MDSLLLYTVKGCISIGSLLLGVGLASGACVKVEIDHLGEFDFGILTEVLALHFHRLKVVTDFYLRDQRLWNKLVRVVKKLADEIMCDSNPQNTRRVLRTQRKIFNLMETLRLTLSETLAVEEVYRVTDDLKQVITDICLTIDR